MGSADVGDIAQPLVGNGIAQRIDDYGLVVRVNTALQQVHRLYHVRMAAHNHIHAHVAQFLGHGALSVVLLKLIFHTPVQEYHGGLSAVCLHIGQVLLYLGVKLIQIGFHEVVDDACLGQSGVAVELRPSVGGYAGGVGVAEHADFDAIHIHHFIFLFLVIEHGAQGFQTLAPNLLQGAQDAGGGGVAAVVVGGEQHIVAGIDYGIHNGIRAVKMGIALNGIIRAAQGGFQIGGGVIVGGGVILQILEDGIKVVAITGGAGVDDGLVHQQVTHGGNTGGSYHGFRFRCGSSGWHLGFRRSLGGCGAAVRQLHGAFRSGNRGSFIHQINAHPDHQGGGSNHQDNQNHQNRGGRRASAVGFTGH